ncbi:MAG: 1-deoxy-D-xylulose-5-phosphate synthase [Paracoccaceae bacterium]
MKNISKTPLLDQIKEPKDLRSLPERKLRQLADELRVELIEVVSQTGGHLGSSLGVVELTVALHAVFDTPRSKIIWDVGHQCYPHKIITGRRRKMSSLRQYEGLSGFTKRSESPYDPFGAAHSSTSISAAMGYTIGRAMGQDVGDTIAVIGDGAMSAGMAYEALNNAGAEKQRLFVILNDNEMSIAPPVGALSQYLPQLYGHRGFHKMKALAEDMEGLLPPPLREGARRARHLVTGASGKGTMFEDLGFDYLGPIDGHDMDQLISTLKAARTCATGPVLIHVLTTKGKGYAPAEHSADKYHGVSKFDIATGQQSKAPANAPSYTSVFGKSLCTEAQHDPKVVAVTAAMPSGTGVNLMQEAFPKRTFDVGIAEQHAVTFCAGMAASGLRPFCAIYSTFLQRGYDQIVHDVALQNLPVRFAIDRAGLVGADGATHAGSYDTAYLSNLPGFVVMAASNEVELMHMVRTAAAYDEGPIAFRYPRGSGVGLSLPERGDILEIGKGRIVQEGSDVALLSFGAHLNVVQEAAVILEKQGHSVTIADARFAKPLDTDLIDQLVNNHRAILTVEQGATGGFATAVMHHLIKTGRLSQGLHIDCLTLPDRFIDQGSPAQMYAEAGLTVEDIAHAAQKLLDQDQSSRRRRTEAS